MLSSKSTNGKSTEAVSINCSIVQGSGLVPIMYIINASDLHPICPTNILLKYADDTYLIIVSSVNTHLIPKELQHVEGWAASNYLKLNVSKSYELIFVSSQFKDKRLIFPAAIPGITRLQHLLVLGVILSSTFKVTKHVEFILKKTSRTMFGLRS